MVESTSVPKCMVLASTRPVQEHTILESSVLPNQLRRTCGVPGMQELIKHAHERHDSAHDSANGGEEVDPSSLVLFNDLHVQRRYLVEEEDPRQASATTGVHMTQMLRDAELVGLDGCTIEEHILRRHHLCTISIPFQYSTIQ